MANQKFLVLRLSAIGDVLRTLPAVKALKEAFPSSWITWVVEEPSEDLLRSQPEVDEVVLFPRRRWAEGIRSPIGIWRTLSDMGRFVMALREKRFDVVLDFHGILKSGLISFLSGSPKRVGFDRKSSKEGNFIFSNVKVKLPEERMSRCQRNFSLLRPLGLETVTLRPAFHVPHRDRAHVERFLETLDGPLPRPWVAIHPGTSAKAAYKRWMPERYAQLGDRLVRELKATVVFTWGPEELDWVEGIRARMEQPSILGPRTESLPQLGELFRRCDLYLGGDTGPMHLASMVGTPVLVIYGPTDPVVNEPLGVYRKVRKEVGCSPCRSRSCKEMVCLRDVTVEEVFDQAREMLVPGS